MKRLLGKNASSGLKSANGLGLGRAAAERGGDFCAAAAEEHQRELIAAWLCRPEFSISA
jgi:hypothetical protein